jgi:hypothetical protein
MKTKSYHTIGTVLKSNRKNVERDKLDTIKHKYTTIGLIQAPQYKVVGLS